MKRSLTWLALFGTLAGALAADPAFTSLPQSRSVRVGDSLAFVVAASGTATLTYQWSYNSAPIAGATTASLSLTNVQLTNAGAYSVLLTNSLGATNASATLSVTAGLLHLYPTNLVVLRAGVGTAALATTGNPLFLDQLTTNGDYVSTVTIPDTGTSALIGFNSATDHYMGSASNNRAVVFGGFNVSRPFSASLSTSTAAAAPRGIGTINGLGYYTLAVSDKNTAYNSQRMLGVTSTDGATEFWTVGGSGVIYVAPSLGPDVSVTTSGGRYAAAIYDGNLYACVSGGLSYFNGLPTAAGSLTRLVSTGNPNDFALSPDRLTLYLTDGSNLSTAGGGVQRWDNVGGTWTKNYTFITPGPASGNNGPDGLVVDFSGFTGGGAAGVGAIVYATSGDATLAKLVRIVDTGASSAVTTIYTSGVNQAIRGIRFGPVADPATITLQPASATSLPGGTVTYSVGVSGSAPFSFQWMRGGTNLVDGGNISGAASATLTLVNVSSIDAAVAYSVVVANDLASTNSSSATLTLTSADPGIVVQPQNVETNFGATARFSARVVGSAPLSIQWHGNSGNLTDGLAPSGAVISGSTSSNLTIAGVSCADAGSYWLSVTNSHGSAVSSNALLVVHDPAIAVQPVGPLVFPGATVSFSVLAAGTGPLSYQWQKDAVALFDGGNVSGSQSNTLTLTSVSNTDAANYSVLIWGGCGSNVVSADAALTLLTPLQSRLVSAGDNVTFVVGATGSATLAYQWSWNGAALAGATVSSLSLANAQLTNAGTYSVLVSNIAGGTSASLSATLNVAAGRLHLYPTNLVVLRAGDGVAGLATTGNPLFLDQLTTNGEYLSTIMVPDSGPAALVGGSALTDEYMGAAGNNRAVLFGGFNVTRPSSVAVAGATAAAVPRGIGTINGLGYYRLAVSDTNSIFNGGRMLGVTSTDGQTEFWTTGGAGVVHSAPGSGPDVTITNGGRYAAVVFNGNLYASLSGGLFQFNGLPATASVGTQLLATGNPNDFALSPDGHTLYLTDGSNVATGFGGIQRWDYDTGISAWNLTYIFQTPVTATTGNNGPDGMTVDFSAFTGGGAAGVGAVIYATTGEATANKLVKVVDQGPGSEVIVLATAGVNQVMRGIRFAPLTDPVSILVQPANQAVPGGTTASFSVTAAGSAPFGYQWRFNGAPIAGATLSALALPNVQPAQIGAYSVVVTNDISSMTSSNATLTLTAPPPPRVSIALSGPTVTITWTNALPTATYRVQFKPNLSATNWTDLTPDVVAAGTTASKTDSPGAGPRFYRVIVP